MCLQFYDMRKGQVGNLVYWFSIWYQEQKMYAGIRILAVLVKPASLVVRTALRPFQILAIGPTFAFQTL